MKKKKLIYTPPILLQDRSDPLVVMCISGSSATKGTSNWRQCATGGSTACNTGTGGTAGDSTCNSGNAAQYTGGDGCNTTGNEATSDAGAGMAVDCATGNCANLVSDGCVTGNNVSAGDKNTYCKTGTGAKQSA